ncbi:MAG TPA: hypothetical protein DCR40_07785 [Prolixibacteraceae bacterium]|nr:hypothetical protein [Prolixibacteraceae bacterium]
MNPKWIHDFCFLCIVSVFHGFEFFMASTFLYIVIGFTNIRILNGTMQHKVLKFFNFFIVFLIVC